MDGTKVVYQGRLKDNTGKELIAPGEAGADRIALESMNYSSRELGKSTRVTARARLEPIVIRWCDSGHARAVSRVRGALGKSPLDVLLRDVPRRVRTWFSMQNTLLRASPLMLAALCTALPRDSARRDRWRGRAGARGLAAASMGVADRRCPAGRGVIAMGLAGVVAGGRGSLLAGGCAFYRGVNETISSCSCRTSRSRS